MDNLKQHTEETPGDRKVDVKGIIGRKSYQRRSARRTNVKSSMVTTIKSLIMTFVGNVMRKKNTENLILTGMI